MRLPVTGLATSRVALEDAKLVEFQEAPDIGDAVAGDLDGVACFIGGDRVIAPRPEHRQQRRRSSTRQRSRSSDYKAISTGNQATRGLIAGIAGHLGMSGQGTFRSPDNPNPHGRHRAPLGGTTDCPQLEAWLERDPGLLSLDPSLAPTERESRQNTSQRRTWLSGYSARSPAARPSPPWPV